MAKTVFFFDCCCGIKFLYCPIRKNTYDWFLAFFLYISLVTLTSFTCLLCIGDRIAYTAIIHIFFGRTPAKVANGIILSITVYMVDTREVFGVRDERLTNKPMHKRSVFLIVFA